VIHSFVHGLNNLNAVLRSTQPSPLLDVKYQLSGSVTKINGDMGSESQQQLSKLNSFS